MTELLQNYAATQARLRPEATAVVGDNETLTYRQLNERSNQLAHMIREAGCQRGDRVCLFVDKTPAAIVAMHAILKADCAYVPVDISSPAKRVIRILNSCEPRMILADGSARKLLDDIFADGGPRQVSIGSLSDETLAGNHFQSCLDARSAARMSTNDHTYANCPTDAAHILFTSGSTGEPKGVVITHENVTHFVNWGNSLFQMGPEDRVSSHSPLHFDLSTFDIYGTLSVGAQLHLVSPTLNLVPTKLAQFIRDAKLTQWFSVPSALTHMVQFDAIGHGDFPDLKRLLWCGEVLPTPTLIHLMERMPHVEFTNLYGPTEATIASSFYSVTDCPPSVRDRIPIGRACAGEQLLVLDSEFQPASPGQTGELYISGIGLSPGYWRDPDKTASAFVFRSDDQGQQQRIYKTGDLASTDEDGLVYFLGRSDTQIKSRGYRIELGEIEAAFNAIDLVQNCAIVAIPSQGFEGTAVCCAYVPKNGSSVSPADLRKQAVQLLPNYMLPGRWKQLSQLPKNPNGKIDRPALQEMFTNDSNV
jgi:amino acid adenylation domain-containing protein